MDLAQHQDEEMPVKALENSFQDPTPSFLQIPAPVSKTDLSSPWKEPDFYSNGNGMKLKSIETEVMDLAQHQDEEMPVKALENSFQDPTPSFLQIPAPVSKTDLSSPWKEPDFYSNGNGMKLKSIETVSSNIEAVPDSFIELLHRLLFLQTDKQSNMRRNIFEFSGLKYDTGLINNVYRMRMLNLLSIEQLKVICIVFHVPVWQYSKEHLVDSIMDFLILPRMFPIKMPVPPISIEDFSVLFDHNKVSWMMKSELKGIKIEEIEVVPDIHISDESPPASKVISLPKNSTKPTEAEDIESVPAIRVHDEAPSVRPQMHYVDEQNQTLSKMMDLPNVFEAYQNYDMNYQRELIKSSITLTLNSDGYSEQAINDEDAEFRMACAKYMRNYVNRHDPSRTTQFQETEEQAASRRAMNAERMRNYRQKMRAHETDEQAATRRAQNAERMRHYRKFKKELEPNLAAERRARDAQRMRDYRKQKRELDPEQAALRRAENAIRMRNYRKSKRQQDPE